MEPLTQERRRGLTRAHLLEAAAQVFAQRGFHGATIDDIAASAGFTKGAVYSNFKNKEDLFLALLEERVQRQFDVVRATLAKTDVHQADDVFASFVPLTSTLLWRDEQWDLLSLEFTLYAARNPSARRKLGEMERRIHGLLAPIVEQQLEQLGTRIDVSADHLATIFLALFQGIGLMHLRDPEDIDEDLVQATMRFLMHAVMPA
jgi:AcrR family transcriptional regulator